MASDERRATKETSEKGPESRRARQRDAQLMGGSARRRMMSRHRTDDALADVFSLQF